MEGKKEGKSSSQLVHFYHNHIVKVGVLHLLCSCCSCLVHAYDIFGFHWNAFMYVGYAWEGLNHVFLNGFLHVLLVLQRIFVGCVGITHPWIGKKWPCMGEGL